MARITCPNEGSPEWKALEDAIGADKAHLAYIRNDNETPTVDHATDLLAQAPEFKREEKAPEEKKPKSEQTELAGLPPKTPPAERADITKPSTVVPETEDGGGPQPKSGVMDKIGAAMKKAYSKYVETPKFTNYKRLVNGSHADVVRGSFTVQKMFRYAVKAVPDKTAREGMTIWREAAGKEDVIREWMEKEKSEWFQDACKAALKLDDDQKKIVTWGGNLYDSWAKTGQAAGIFKNFRDNYINRIVDYKPEDRETMTGVQAYSGAASKLKEQFSHSKQRTFPTLFDVAQGGFKPETLDFAELMAVYASEFNKVINTRKFIKALLNEKHEDGTPLAVVSGAVHTIEKEPKNLSEGEQQWLFDLGDHILSKDEVGAYFIEPKQTGKDFKIYRDVENRGLKSWKFIESDPNGAPMLFHGDIKVHPDIATHMNNVFGPDKLAQLLPIIKTIEKPQVIAKEFMFAISGFHFVQEGTHGIWHRVNPFPIGMEPLDLENNEGQIDATNHSLELWGEYDGINEMMEGLSSHKGLFKKIPILGKIQEVANDALFKQYIPALKYATYKAILKRNTKLYDKEIESKKNTLDDIKYLSAQQANAAYGALNYTDLGRNKGIQHLLRFSLLAPDFLEARTRFALQAGKTLLGSKAGHEQFVAMAVNISLLYGASAVINGILHSDEPNKSWAEKMHLADAPFEVVVGNRRYGLRSVASDLFHFFQNWHQFVLGRISPIFGKGVMEGIMRVDYRGQPITEVQALKDVLGSYMPISIGGGVGEFGAVVDKFAPKNVSTKFDEIMKTVSPYIPISTNRNKDINAYQQILNAMGIQVSRFSPLTEFYEKLHDWEKDQGTGNQATFPPSKFRDLRNALQDDNYDVADKRWNALIDEEAKKGKYKEFIKGEPTEKDKDKIRKAAEVNLLTGFERGGMRSFSGSELDDAKFAKTLSPMDQLRFKAARIDKFALLMKFKTVFQKEMQEQEKKEEPKTPDATNE